MSDPFQPGPTKFLNLVTPDCVIEVILS